MEKIVVTIIVAAAILLLVRHFWQTAKGKKNNCACGSTGCDLKNRCSENEPSDKKPTQSE